MSLQAAEVGIHQLCIQQTDLPNPGNNREKIHLSAEPSSEAMLLHRVS